MDIFLSTITSDGASIGIAIILAVISIFAFPVCIFILIFLALSKRYYNKSKDNTRLFTKPLILTALPYFLIFCLFPRCFIFK